jgi:hypothetical protein
MDGKKKEKILNAIKNVGVLVFALVISVVTEKKLH